LIAKKLSWGVIGCAQIAINTVIPAIQNSASGEVVAIASRSEEKARKTADLLGIPKAYGSYEQLIEDPDIDAVYIPLPNHLHREWVIRAAKAGKHILCEKPFAMNAYEAEEMVEAAKIAGVKLAEAFMYRYHPRYEMIHEIIASGEIGEVRAVQVAFSFNIDDVGVENNIRLNASMGGGGLYDVGCYTISGARLVLGLEPEAATVLAIMAPEHGNVDIMTSGLIEFPKGIGLSFQCGMSAEFRNTLQIAGTLGRIDIPEAYVCQPETANFNVIVKGKSREIIVPIVNQYELQVEEFSRHVLEDEPLRFPAEDAILNMKVIDACYQSTKSRSRVTI
jgi:xylose dehydrogenase (NAD/NADP)